MADGPVSVFISYSRKDSTFVDQLETDLRRYGFDTWVDRQHLEGGADWERMIEQQIIQRTTLIVALSPDAVASDWVRREIKFALNAGKYVIPVIARPVQHFPIGIVDKQYINLDTDYISGLQELRVSLLNAAHSARSHGDEDGASRELVETYAKASDDAHNAQKMLNDLDDKLPADQKAKANVCIADVRSALDTNDTTRIKSARNALQAAMVQVVESVYYALPISTSYAPSESTSSVTMKSNSADKVKLTGRKIFICYSSNDNAWCHAFANALRVTDADIWYDASGLHDGAKWTETIEQEIEARDIFLVLLSPDAWDSYWVKLEIGLAFCTKRTIVPVMINQTEVTGFMRTIPFVDAIGMSAAAAAKAVAAHLATLPRL